MDFNDVVFSRRSIRKFIDKDVEEEKVKLLLRYAMASPSAMNKRPLKYIVIQNKDILNTEESNPILSVAAKERIGLDGTGTGVRGELTAFLSFIKNHFEPFPKM